MAAVLAPSHHDRSEPTRPHLRLVPPPTRRRRGRPSAAVYRRRRLVACLLLVTVVALLAIAVSALWPSGRAASNGSPLTPSGASAGAAVQAARPIATDVYVVRSGDTLWSIARALHPSGDVRPIVDRLAAGRHGAPLQPGERIALP